MTAGYVYIASPYTDDDPAVETWRHDQALHFTAENLAAGVTCFSPIVHCRPIAITRTLPGDFEFWQRHNFAWLAGARELWVLMLPGWGDSDGVTAEIEEARRLGIPVRFVPWRLL